MKNLLPALLALVSVVIAVFSFLQYRNTASALWLGLTIVFLVAFLGLGAMFLSSRVNKTEDIHITE